MLCQFVAKETVQSTISPSRKHMTALLCLYTCIQSVVQIVGVGLEELFDARRLQLKIHITMKFMLPVELPSASKKRLLVEFLLTQL